MVDKSFSCREILHLSAHLPESPSAWALFSLGPYFLVVFYSQWTYIGDGLASFRPMDMDPSGPSCRACQILFLSSSDSFSSKCLLQNNDDMFMQHIRTKGQALFIQTSFFVESSESLNSKTT